MTIPLIIAITAISLALVFYTIGVFGERHTKMLKGWQVAIFWLGLICDTTGTTVMTHIAQSGGGSMSQGGLSLHGITGAIAIILMLFHAGWATWVLLKGNASQKATFHKFSLIVWLIWLIPYFIGMFLGML